jgi:hypothetical protein
MSDLHDNNSKLKPLLPKLTENPRLSFPKAGVWDDRNLPALDDLISSLKVERKDFTLSINAIPDIWARPLLFDMALFDREHLLHKCILGEWRGLLAMMALWEIRGFSLSVKPVVIPSLNEVNQGNSNILPFEAALAKLIPNKTLATDTTWNNFYVILFDDKPVGMTSPTTLVCTAADYYNRIHGVTWFDGRYLGDPVPELNEWEKQELGGWLTKLNGVLAAQPELQRFGSIVGLINEFIEDLVGKDVRKEKLSYSESPSSLDMTIGLFRFLNHPIKIGDKHSNVQLEPSTSKNPSTKLLVVDPYLAEYWGIPKQNINVIGGITLASFPFSGLGSAKNGKEFGQNTLPDGVEWCTPQYFFTDKFFVIGIPDALPGMVTGIRGIESLKFLENVVTPILPLNANILDYLDRNDLSQRVSVENIADGFKVKLRLPLSGSNGEGREFEVSHEYHSDKGDVIRLDNLPLLEIWPNFDSKSWQAYYIYYDTVGRQSTFYAKPAGTMNSPNSKAFSNSRGEIEREITRTNTFPEAFICESKIGNNKHTAGIILLKQPVTPVAASESWKVGIDFGTSGTNVFAGADGIEPFQVVFKERLMQITKPGAARVDLYKYFIQDDPERKNSFLSIFHDFQNQSADQSVLEPLLNGHIYFLANIKEFRSKTPGMVVDLKWGSSEERNKARAFLEQLCLQCSAEAVLSGAKEISWRFSYPTAFSVKDKEAFLHIWETICKSCNEKTGFKSIGKEPRNMSESVAAAHFFANFDDIKAKLGRGAVCIDIGGGTSDISVWQGSDIKLRWQTSLLYAGRDIFLELLRRKPEFLENFKIGEQTVEYLKVIKGDPKAFYVQADAVIIENGAKMLEQLPILGAEPMVKEFTDLMAVGLAGLFYYVGLLLNDLYSKKCYQLRMPNIFIGGNGSQMFKWVSSGSYTIDSAVNLLFKDILTQATGFKSEEKYEIQLSPRPKAEVAYGLVRSDLIAMNYSDDTATQGILAGEEFFVKVALDSRKHVAATREKEVSNTSKAKQSKVKTASLEECNYAWNTLLSSDMVLANIEVSNLKQLKTFLEKFNLCAAKAGIEPVKFDKELLVAVADDVNQKLSQYASIHRENKDAIQVEPLFIRALKSFMEMKADEWENKYRSN